MGRFLLLLLASVTASNAGPLTFASCTLASTSRVVSDPAQSACSIPAANPAVSAKAEVSESFGLFAADVLTSVGAEADSVTLPPLTQFQVSSGAVTGNIEIETPANPGRGSSSSTLKSEIFTAVPLLRASPMEFGNTLSKVSPAVVSCIPVRMLQRCRSPWVLRSTSVPSRAWFFPVISHSTITKLGAVGRKCASQFSRRTVPRPSRCLPWPSHQASP